MSPVGPSDQASLQSLQIIPQQTTGGGYWCASCGVWVMYGVSHFCPSWQQYQQPIWWWPMTTVPTKTTFKGQVKDMAGLPRDAKVGDSYYVKDWNSLLTRVNEGWLLNMAEDDES